MWFDIQTLLKHRVSSGEGDVLHVKEKNSSFDLCSNQQHGRIDLLGLPKGKNDLLFKLSSSWTLQRVRFLYATIVPGYRFAGCLRCPIAKFTVPLSNSPLWKWWAAILADKYIQPVIQACFLSAQEQDQTSVASCFDCCLLTLVKDFYPVGRLFKFLQQGLQLKWRKDHFYSL